MDIRDGTKTVYLEKRRSPRVRPKDDMVAKIKNSKPNDSIKVVDISCVGALIQTAAYFQPGEKVDLCIHLPLFPQPIEMGAHVVRSLPSMNGDTPTTMFDVAIEFTEICKRRDACLFS